LTLPHAGSSVAAGTPSQNGSRRKDA
jgi:hypothetical protein